MSEYRYYELALPVFKRGDDFNYCLRARDNDISRALSEQADWYAVASERCLRLRSILLKTSTEIEMRADGNQLAFIGRRDIFDQYASSPDDGLDTLLYWQEELFEEDLELDDLKDEDLEEIEE